MDFIAMITLKNYNPAPLIMLTCKSTLLIIPLILTLFFFSLSTAESEDSAVETSSPLQDAVDLAIKEGRSAVRILGGTYDLSTPLVIPAEGNRLFFAAADENNPPVLNALGNPDVIIIKANDVTLSNLYIQDFTGTGITVMGDGVRVVNNVLHGMDKTSLSRAGKGILLDSVNNAVVSGNSIEDCDTGLLLRGLSENTRITMNKFFRNGVGISNVGADGEWPVNIRVLNNNIGGRDSTDSNDLGADWEGVDVGLALRASMNWWGHEEGPEHEDGDNAEGNIDYRDWLTNPPEGYGAGAFARSRQSGKDEDNGLEIIVSGTAWDGEVYAFSMTENSIESSLDTPATYARLFVERAKENISEIEYRIGCVENESDSLKAYWYNGGSWKLCSHQTKVNDDDWIEGFAGYVSILINSETEPSLTDDFSSVDFALTEHSVDDSSEGSSSSDQNWYECFIASAVYGSPIAQEVAILRKFRDRCLKRTDLGRVIVNMYYSISPPIAEKVEKNDSLKKLMLHGIEPFVNMVRKLML